MRREQPGTHAAHREEEHQHPPTHAIEEPRKRSYERVIDGEEPFPDDLTDGLTDKGLPVEPEAIDVVPAKAEKAAVEE